MIGRGQAPDWLDVSRETLDRLSQLLSMVEKWNPAINLVANGSLPEAWLRHVLDSAQLFILAPQALHWADFGSGAGFPGLVVGILAKEANPAMRLTLVESDRRKAAFLAQAARGAGIAVNILTDRAERLAPIGADVVSARALASLPDLCVLAHRHLAQGGYGMFPKGAQTEAEITEARVDWRFDVEFSPSKTDPSGQIIKVSNLRHA